MSRFAAEVSRNTGTNNRDGTRARDSRPGHCPVPDGVPIRPGSVPFYPLGNGFEMRLHFGKTGWVNALVRHVSQVHGSGSWRVSWSLAEHRFAMSSELHNMRSRQPWLDDAVQAVIERVAVERNAARQPTSPARAISADKEGARS